MKVCSFVLGIAIQHIVDVEPLVALNSTSEPVSSPNITHLFGISK